MTHYITGGFFLGALLALLGGCGGSATSSGAPAEVEVTLSEYRVASSLTSFSKSAPFRFAIKNAGTTEHEWMVMPRGATEHSKMLAHAGMPAGSARVQEFTFKRAGDYEFACHLPGHYEAGMVLPITIQ
ncbi:MAG: hypothetical protein HY688_05425 [Chloroflexi bacterium]|nr:hypothetical protein [Chloroflexota bacterium]